MENFIVPMKRIQFIKGSVPANIETCLKKNFIPSVLLFHHSMLDCYVTYITYHDNLYVNMYVHVHIDESCSVQNFFNIKEKCS